MRKPIANTVTFPQGKFGKTTNITYIASRPEVLPVLKEIIEASYGWCVTFRGTDFELVAAGIALAYMFDIGKSVQRTYRLEFGDECTVNRRGKQWEVCYRVYDTGHDGLPTDSNPEKRAWWIKHGGAAEVATVEILKRFSVTPS